MSEIETLLGRQAVDDLGLETLEVAVRQQALDLAGPSRRTAGQRGYLRLRLPQTPLSL
jgi:hypothetical protein